LPHADANLAVTSRAVPAGPCLVTVAGELDYHPPVFRLLSFTGLDRLFRSYDSVEAALSALTA